MDWSHTFIELDAFLSDDKVQCDVDDFLAAVGYSLEIDEEIVVFPPATRAAVEERMLVRNPQVRGGGYFLVKSVLLPPEEGIGSGCEHLGKLKIMYDLEGCYVDDFYSRY